MAKSFIRGDTAAAAAAELPNSPPPHLPLPPSAAGAPQGRLEVLPSQYPVVRRDEAVVDTLHGVAVPDPYRWLEDPDAPETAAFVAAQNALTEGVLAGCESRVAFRALFTRLYDYQRYGTPFRKGGRYFYTMNTGLQNQSVVYSQASLEGEPSVLIDPNALSADGTVALMGWAFSESGRLLAYSLSSGGSDWRSVRVMRIDQESGEGADLEDRLEHVKVGTGGTGGGGYCAWYYLLQGWWWVLLLQPHKARRVPVSLQRPPRHRPPTLPPPQFSSLAWTHDEAGFFYNRYDPPAPAPGGGELGTETGANLRQQLAYHVLGRPQSEDVTVLTLPDHPEWMVGAEVSHCGRYLILSVSAGCEPTNRLWYVDLEALPREGGGGGPLDLKGFEVGAEGAAPLPVFKLVDSFEVGCRRLWGRAAWGAAGVTSTAGLSCLPTCGLRPQPASQPTTQPRVPPPAAGSVRVCAQRGQRVDAADQRRRAAVPARHRRRSKPRGGAGGVAGPAAAAPARPAAVGVAAGGRRAGGVLPGRRQVQAGVARPGRRRAAARAGAARDRVGVGVQREPPPQRVFLLLHLLHRARRDVPRRRRRRRAAGTLPPHPDQGLLARRL